MLAQKVELKGEYIIEIRDHPNLVLGVADSSIGTRVTVQKMSLNPSGDPKQLWKLAKLFNYFNFYFLKNVDSNLYMNLDGNSLIVTQREYTGNDDQWFWMDSINGLNATMIGNESEKRTMYLKFTDENNEPGLLIII
ncbi:unnamed protein product [Didymodactylos carnosus]|uniref:Uncharacterized protein n=1 Tax=Didymodactylos carnosus TaxID=1234261 RepID=A0A814X7V9_9BILA|nr:unnamed protein product [Didymodactylos carnosus]CAF3979370.1 unnamed protein product [Didymodactylos carnosus]